MVHFGPILTQFREISAYFSQFGPNLVLFANIWTHFGLFGVALEAFEGRFGPFLGILAWICVISKGWGLDLVYF